MLLFDDCRLALASSPPAAPELRDRAAGALAARRALAALLGESESGIEISHHADGAPSCGLDDVALSVAHRDGRGVAIAARGALRLGVDFERARSVSPDHARYFLSPRERETWEGTDLTTLWAIKEAAWKALRCGHETPFRALTVDRGTRAGECVLRVGARRIPARFAVLRPRRGWIVAAVRATSLERAA